MVPVTCSQRAFLRLGPVAVGISVQVMRSICCGIWIQSVVGKLILFLLVASDSPVFAETDSVDTAEMTGENILLDAVDDSLIWEAEWANRISGTYEVTSSSDSAGPVALWSREGTGRHNISPMPEDQNNPEIDMGVADYYFSVPRAGRYRIFMRIWAMDKCGNSCWVAIDDLSPEQTTYFPGGRTGILGSSRHNQWPESSLNRWIWATDETQSYMLTEGIHHLRVRVREDGFGIDQVAIMPANAKMPSERLRPNYLPGSDGLPAGVSYSIQSRIGNNDENPTPFDVFLTVSHAVMAGSPGRAHATAWVRLNAERPAAVMLNVESAAGSVRPAGAFSCVLTPSAPLVKIPMAVEGARGLERRGYRLSLQAESPEWPGLRLSRQRNIKRELDWVVTSPLTYRQASQILMQCVKNRPTDKVALERIVGEEGARWATLDPRKHMNAFGAVDLIELYGENEYSYVVAATWVTVAKNWEGVAFAAGDDALKLYAGERLIASDYLKGPLTDSIGPRRVRLAQGRHLIMALVAQRERCWQFQVDFRDFDGRPTAEVAGIDWD